MRGIVKGKSELLIGSVVKKYVLPQVRIKFYPPEISVISRMLSSMYFFVFPEPLF